MHRLGDAAADGKIGLEDVGRLSDGEIAEIIAGELALAGGDRHAAGGAHLGHAGLVVAGDRLLEPGEIAIATRCAKRLASADRVGAVRIDHDVDVGPECRRGPP